MDGDCSAAASDTAALVLIAGVTTVAEAQFVAESLVFKSYRHGVNIRYIGAMDFECRAASESLVLPAPRLPVAVPYGSQEDRWKQWVWEADGILAQAYDLNPSELCAGKKEFCCKPIGNTSSSGSSVLSSKQPLEAFQFFCPWFADITEEFELFGCTWTWTGLMEALQHGGLAWQSIKGDALLDLVETQLRHVHSVGRLKWRVGNYAGNQTQQSAQSARLRWVGPVAPAASSRVIAEGAGSFVSKLGQVGQSGSPDSALRVRPFGQAHGRAETYCSDDAGGWATVNSYCVHGSGGQGQMVGVRAQAAKGKYLLVRSPCVCVCVLVRACSGFQVHALVPQTPLASVSWPTPLRHSMGDSPSDVSLHSLDSLLAVSLRGAEKASEKFPWEKGWVAQVFGYAPLPWQPRFQPSPVASLEVKAVRAPEAAHDRLPEIPLVQPVKKRKRSAPFEGWSVSLVGARRREAHIWADLVRAHVGRSPVAQQMNQMLAGGASADHIAEFVEILTVDRQPGTLTVHRHSLSVFACDEGESIIPDDESAVFERMSRLCRSETPSRCLQ
eukprot:1586538-Amphidinium_carterae.1